MNMKKVMWGGLGFLSLGVAYVGVILPGIPFSIPAYLQHIVLQRVQTECTIGYTIINYLDHS